MRVIISGSRGCMDYQLLLDAITESGFIPSVIIHGDCPNCPDQLGERYAYENNVPVERFPAEWDLYGKSAGFRRNKDMAKVANALISIWDGKSSGTKNMIEIAGKYKILVYTKVYE